MNCELAQNQYFKPQYWEVSQSIYSKKKMKKGMKGRKKKKSHRRPVCDSHHRFHGEDFGYCRKLRLGRLADCSRSEKWQLCPMTFYNHSSLWIHCIMGLRSWHPPFWTREKPGGWEALEQKWNNHKQGLPQNVGAFFVYSDQRSSTFLSYKDLSFIFIFQFSFLSKPNMLLIVCMLYVWLLRERKLMNKRCQLC